MALAATGTDGHRPAPAVLRAVLDVAPRELPELLVSYRELRLRTGFSEDVFRRGARAGELTPYGPPRGRGVRFDLAEVIDWLDRSADREPTPRTTTYARASGLAGTRRRW